MVASSETRVAREPLMHAAIEVQHFTKAGAGLSPEPMAAPGPMFLHQSRGLQGLLRKAIRHGHAVLAPGDLVKVPDIEARIPLAIKSQDQLELLGWDPAL